MKTKDYKSIKDYKLLCNRLKIGPLAMSTGILSLAATGAHAQAQFELRSNNPLSYIVNGDGLVPVAADLDGDGRKDLFFPGFTEGENGNARDNALVQYSNVDGVWTRVSAPFAEDLGIQTILDTSEVYIFPSFVDFDSDGDTDVFLNIAPGGGVKYYSNENGTMVLQSDEINPFSDFEYPDDNELLYVGDLDGDGTFEAVVPEEEGTFIYNLEDGNYVKGEEIAGASFIGALHDADGDGDLDYITGNKYGQLNFYENVDGALSLNSANNPYADVTLGSYTIPAFMDLDEDGLEDIVLGNGSRLSYLNNNGTGFDHIGHNIQGITTEGNTLVNPEFVDIDGDGDLDIFSGTYRGLIIFLENEGGRYTVNEEMNPFKDAADLGDSTQPRFADVDGDGDMDCLVGKYSGAGTYFENVDGTLTQVDSIANPFAAISSGNSLKYAFEDYDDDGDVDLFVGNKYGEITAYQNTDGVFTEVTIEGISDYESSYSVPAFGDVDNDGDRDLVIGTSYGTIDILYKDNGVYAEDETKEYPFDTDDFISSASPAFGDIDLDGDEDMIVGTGGGEIMFMQNQLLSSSIPTLQLLDGVKIFPNPTSNILNVEVPWKVDQLTVTISSIDGQLISIGKENNSQFTIETSSLAPGYYTLLISGDEYLSSKKFIKID